MRYLPPEPEIELYETVFDDDILEREKVSKSLSALIDRIEDPLVIALDGRWGTGKSYFLKRWVGAHRIQNNGKALTLYFDAFANDYLSDPLIALVAALAERMPAKDALKLKRLKATATQFLRPLLKVGLNVATFGAKDAVDELASVAIDAANAETQKAVDYFWEREEGRQKAMQAFREQLLGLIEGSNGDDLTPMVIVIDELDRCRPDYALEILEVIKHFFSVPMVHFVLGVNLAALENSVRARYGQEIDSIAYLQKFISLTLSLPDHVGNRYQEVPTVLAYAKHVAKAMQLPEAYVEEIVDSQLPGILRQNSVSIRDINKILGAVAILPNGALNPRMLGGWRSIIGSMIVARVIRKDFFDKMVNCTLSDDELVSYLDATPTRIESELPDGNQNDQYHHPTWYLYRLWQVILSDGAAQFDGAKDVKRQFSEFGHVKGARRYPKQILDEFLNNFEAL